MSYIPLHIEHTNTTTPTYQPPADDAFGSWRILYFDATGSFVADGGIAWSCTYQDAQQSAFLMLLKHENAVQCQIDEIRTYIIAEMVWEQETAPKLAKLQAKATQLGAPAITWAILGHEDREDEDGTSRRYSIVEVNGIAPMLQGWHFAASLEPTPDGNLIKRVPGFVGDIPEVYRANPPTCDHCQKNRKRALCYLVVHDHGAWMQVGKTCLRDFLGHADPHGLLRIAELFDELLTDSEASDADRFGGADRTYDTLDVLQHAVAIIGRHGWTSRSAAEISIDKIATADLVADNIRELRKAGGNLFDSRGKERYVPINEQDAAKAAAALAWVNTELREKRTLGDYEHNLVVACAQERFTKKNIGLVVSLISAYDRARGAIVAKQREAATSEHLGAVGDRLMFTVTVEKVVSTDGNYGVSYFIVMHDQDKNVLTWRTTTELEIGERYVIRARVKEHTQFNGVNQTIITRGTIEQTIPST